MKTIVPQAKLRLPFVKDFGDYHDIYAECDLLNELFEERIKCKEVAFDGRYWGLFYVGVMPTKSEIRKMLKDAE